MINHLTSVYSSIGYWRRRLRFAKPPCGIWGHAGMRVRRHVASASSCIWTSQRYTSKHAKLDRDRRRSLGRKTPQP